MLKSLRYDRKLTIMHDMLNLQVQKATLRVDPDGYKPHAAALERWTVQLEPRENQLECGKMICTN